MSLIPLGVTLAEAGVLELISPVLIRPRNIGPFIADVTIEEIGEDVLEITEHPVEQGAAISDHSYKQPARLTIRAGWSDSSDAGSDTPQYSQQTYNQFLALQASRQPFDVVTGKRTYQNMLIARLMQTTNEQTENGLSMVVDLKQIIITTTQTVTLPSTDNMATPAANAPVQNAGTKSAQDADDTFNSPAAAQVSPDLGTPINNATEAAPSTVF